MIEDFEGETQPFVEVQINNKEKLLADIEGQFKFDFEEDTISNLVISVNGFPKLNIKNIYSAQIDKKLFKIKLVSNKFIEIENYEEKGIKIDYPCKAISHYGKIFGFSDERNLEKEEFEKVYNKLDKKTKSNMYNNKTNTITIEFNDLIKCQ